MIGSFGGNAVTPSGWGNTNPSELSNGLPEGAKKRPFHISLGKNALLTTVGVRRWLRGPKRFRPTRLLFWIPMAIDCVSPKPAVGEWQPAHALSECREAILSKNNSRPRIASVGFTGRPSRA